MFKSKHSGWTWELKRTPHGGGGGGGFIGDPFQGIGDALASVDPGPAIGDALASVDQAVNQVPGGWITVGGLATGGAALAYAPEVMSLAAETGVEPAVAAEQLGIPPVDVATGAEVPFSTTTTAGADAVLSAPDVSVNLGATDVGTVGSLNPALPAVGAPEGTSIGMSAGLPPGTVLGTGLPGGGVAGVSYAAGPNGLPATDFFGNYIPASSINFGGVPSTVAGTSYNLDTLKQLNQARGGLNTASNLAKMLSQGSLSGLSGSLGKLAQGANPPPLGLVNAVRGNATPFAQEQYFQVSKPHFNLAELVQLLKQG